jgi:hypothetical protein
MPGRPTIEITATPCRHGPPLSHPLIGDVVGFALSWETQHHGVLWISGDTPREVGLSERSQTVFDASLVQLATGRIDDDTGREPEIFGDLVVRARQGSDVASVAGQRRNEYAVARSSRVGRRSAAGRETQRTYEHDDGDKNYSPHAVSPVG